MTLRVLGTLIAILWLAAPTTGSAQVADLTSKLRRDANALVAIDAAALRTTPLAQQQGWTKKLEAAYVDRAVFLPPETEKLLLTSHVLPHEEFRMAWELAVMTLSEPLSMRAIARAEGGYVDQIGGKEAVWSPSDAYLVALDEQTLGIVSPGDRQDVARWVQEASQNHFDKLSPYLQLAVSRVTPETQIVLAIDLKDAVSPHRVEDRLKQSEIMQKTSQTLPAMISLIQSLEGATIEVSIGTKATAKSRVDFGQPVSLNDTIAKRLVLEALEQLGVQVTDLADHKFTVIGKSIIVEGDLSTAGLRRILSVLEVPTTKFSELKEETAEGQTASAGDMGEKSQVYYRTVVSLLDDLRGDREKQDTRGGMDAVWMERYARKIDRLPILYVDEELLAWGSDTAQTLRVMATTRRGAGLAAGSQKSALRSDAYIGVYYNYSYGYGGAGYTGVSGSTAYEKDRNQIDRQLQNQATAKKVEGWRLIEDASAEIRKTMTQRYGIEF